MILVTDDDGYTEGAKILLEVAKEFSNSYGLFPEKQKSAVSVAITLHKALRIRKVENDVWTISGTPADAVLFSVYSKEFITPGLVLSGINAGDNCAMSSFLSSGTIGACWKATLEGIPSIAFSKYISPENWGKGKQWKQKKEIKDVLRKVIKKLIKKKKKNVFYNVSIPEIIDKPKIVFIKKPQRLRFKAVITKRMDPNGIPYYWLSGDFREIEKGTDLHELAVKKNVVITPVHLSFKER